LTPLSHSTTLIRDLSFGAFQILDRYSQIYLLPPTAGTFLTAIHIMKRVLIN